MSVTLERKSDGVLGHLYTTDALIVVAIGGETFTYKSLTELDKVWKVYEAPKEFWYIDDMGNIYKDREEACASLLRENIGNHFKTKAEAEQVLEKLKAWKRLKDKRFRFKGWSVVEGISFKLSDDFYDANDLLFRDVRDDLDLLFGGEDEKEGR